MILPGVTIGRFALVGAGAVVTEDVGVHELVIGNPARMVGYACVCGFNLAKDPPSQCGSFGRSHPNSVGQ